VLGPSLAGAVDGLCFDDQLGSLHAHFTTARLLIDASGVPAQAASAAHVHVLAGHHNHVPLHIYRLLLSLSVCIKQATHRGFVPCVLHLLGRRPQQAAVCGLQHICTPCIAMTTVLVWMCTLEKFGRVPCAHYATFVVCCMTALGCSCRNCSW
jgi:hypothetical protein